MSFTLPSETQNILAVDDQPDNLFLLESILDDTRYALTTVESGEAALRAIDSQPPDLVLLDVMMPGMDGYEVTRRIRNREDLSYIPILLITAHNQPTVVEGLDAGADDFIRKPFDMDELQARVRSLLRLKASIDAQTRVLQQRDDFVARMTHDLRTPLVAANRMLQFCLDETFGSIAEEAKEAIANILRSNQNLLSMVNTLLEVYRHEAGQYRLTQLSFNFYELVETVVAELEGLAIEKQLALDFFPPLADDGDRSTFEIYADRSELRRVITNLIGNAIKFTDAGHIHVSLSRQAKLPQDIAEAIAAHQSFAATTANDPNLSFAGDSGSDQESIQESGMSGEFETSLKSDLGSSWLLFQVKDTGVGIALEQQAEMFEWFRQGKHRRSGSGLGLHLAQRIASLHGGLITVESTLGEGSCFRLYLPQRLPE